MDLLRDGITSGISLIAGASIFILVMAALCEFRRDRVQSRVGAGLIGSFIIFWSVVAGFGTSCAVGITVTPLHLQVLPFLGVALGVCHLFIMNNALVEDRNRAVDAIMSSCMKAAGPQVAMVSLLNFLVFLLGAAAPLPNISLLCLSAALVTLFSCLYAIFGYSVVLAWDIGR